MRQNRIEMAGNSSNDYQITEDAGGTQEERREREKQIKKLIDWMEKKGRNEDGDLNLTEQDLNYLTDLDQYNVTQAVMFLQNKLNPEMLAKQKKARQRREVGRAQDNFEAEAELVGLPPTATDRQLVNKQLEREGVQRGQDEWENLAAEHGLPSTTTSKKLFDKIDSKEAKKRRDDALRDTA